MKLYFLRHADAKEGADDEVRPLSAHGRKEAKAIGKFLKKAAIGFNAAYSSPLVRARETAELVLTACGSSPELGLQTERSLTNETPQDVFETWLSDLKLVEHVLLVGHAPSLSAHARKILKLDSSGTLELSKGGLLCIEAFEGADARILFYVTPASLGVFLPARPSRRLRMTQVLFNSDDFGKSLEVNAAILRAHREGLLGSASLMVTGAAFQEAVEIARANPRLKVGLHLVLCDAAPALAQHEIPQLVDVHGMLHRDPAKAGMRIAFCGKTKAQAALEIAAQFRRYAETGLPRAHVDGHHHLHMHPFIFRECVRWAVELRFQRIRVVREFGDPLPPRRDASQFPVRLARHYVFSALASFARKQAAAASLEAFDGVVGLWETGRVSEDYLLSVIPRIQGGRWEIYNHVGSAGAEEELQAMLSGSLKEKLKHCGVDVL